MWKERSYPDSKHRVCYERLQGRKDDQESLLQNKINFSFFFFFFCFLSPPEKMRFADPFLHSGTERMPTSLLCA